MYRYTLEPYKSPKSRFRCPQCNYRSLTFSRYIDTQTGDYLGDKVGRCSRENNCGYHFTPGEHFKEVGSNQLAAGGNQLAAGGYQLAAGGYQVAAGSNNRMRYEPPAINYHLPPDYLPAQLVTSSFTDYTKNNFMQYLCKLFGDKIAFELTDRYYIGTSNHWPGANVFWQIDMQGNVRTGKIMLYYADTGKRVKEPFNHINWAHTKAGGGQFAAGSGSVGSFKSAVGSSAGQTFANCKRPTANFNLDQCLFGEHLLDESRPYYDKTGKPIALVESEKTAIIASVHLQQYVWLATGSIHNLNAAKCQVLKGHKVMLFPDVNAYQTWQRKASDLELLLPKTRFEVSDFLELNANAHERHESWDLGDYLVG